MRITTSGIDSFTIKNRTVQRLAVTGRIVTTSGTPTADWNKIQVRCFLTRNSEKITVFNSTLGVLSRESMYQDTYEYITTQSTLPLVATLTYVIPLTIDLGSVINVMGTDELTVEVDAQALWYGSANVTAASCYLNFEWRDRIGVEKATPIINVKVVKTNAGEFQESLGDNVTSITWVNTGTSVVNPTDSTRVITNFIVESDKYRVNDSTEAMIARRATQYLSQANALLRGHTFKYEPEQEIDAVRVDITLTSANVAVSENYMVWRSMLVRSSTINRAQALSRKHGQRDTVKLNKMLS